MVISGVFVGIVVDIDTSKYVDRVQVRVPMVHGSSENGNSESLPWVKVVTPPGSSINSLNSLYAVGDLVYVSYQGGAPLVIGIYRDKDSVDTSTLLGGTAKSGGAGRGTTSQISPGTTYKRDTSLSEEFICPLESINVTSEYGSRWGTTHWGIDLGAPLRTTVRAALDGVVYTAVNGFPSPSADPPSRGVAVYDGNSLDSYGNYIIIDHGVLSNGHHYYTKYAHLTQASVKAGQVVKKGDIIGLSGSSGNSSGGHLHFEIDVDGTYAFNGENPRNYIVF